MRIPFSKRQIFGTLLCFLFFGFTRGDNEVIKTVASLLENWTVNYPQEKVYLHLDKPYYAAGDSIWFKAYLTAGPLHQLSAISGVLQVELINEQNEVQHTLNLPVADGITWGDIALPGNLPAGTYRLRAYTNWMRNFGNDYFYDEPLTIGNAASPVIQTNAAYSYSGQQTNASLTFTDANNLPQAGKSVSYGVLLDGRKLTEGMGKTDVTGKLALTFATQTTTGVTSYRLGQIISRIVTGNKDTITRQVTFNPAAAQADVQFFPEGGNLVNGISSVVAFKAVGADGLGLEVNGQVFDSSNTKIADFTTQHLGMGSFTLSPEQGKTYYAVINYPDGSKRTLNLPQAQNTGYIMAITAAGKNHRVRVAASTDLATTGNATINLIAQQGGKIYYAATALLNVDGFSASLPDSRFPAGIVQFKLFSGKGQPIAERLVFINNDAALLNVNIASAKNTYTPHENTKINLHIQNNEGKPVLGSFSASVINEDKMPTNGFNENTILSNILLTSDLQGYIEQPAYYFKPDDEKAPADLDALMLTQGYRRIEWKQLLGGSLPAIMYHAQTGISVSGRVTAYGKPVPGGKITMFTTQGGTMVLDTVSDKDGKFSFNNLQFADSLEFTIQARTAKGAKDVEVVLDRPATVNPSGPKVSNVMLTTPITAPAYANYLKSKQQQYQHDMKYGLNGRTTNLKTVTIKAERPVLQHSSNLNGPGVANQVFMGDDVFKNKGCLNVLECLEGKLHGVDIVFVPGLFGGKFIAISMRRGKEMQAIIDGVPGDINDVNPNDVQSIEILNSQAYTAIYGGDGGNGIILVDLKHGNDDGQFTRHIKAPGVITYSPKGLYVAREFYKPVYKAPFIAGQTDNRSTIDWENNLVTDKDGNASFSYFNAASKGTYRVLVEGIDIDGHLGRQVYRYKVE